MPAPPSPKHIFMSYSRKDEAVMQRILTFLRKQGIHVWLDNEKLIPGTPIWEREIEQAIKTAAAIVVICSPDSNNSEWVRREITFAERYRKRIFPILARGDEDSSISIRLSTRQYVDIRQNEEVGICSLSVAISSYLEELEAQEREQQRIAAEERTRAEAEEQARKEREAREKRAAEEKARKAKEVQEQKTAEEHDHKIAEEKSRKDIRAWKRKSPEEPVRISAEKAQSEKTLERPARKLNILFFIAGGIILSLLILGVNSIFQNWFSTAGPTQNVVLPTTTPRLDLSEKDDMVMAYVPAGEFEMGIGDSHYREGPAHTVYLDAFWIDRTEVTNVMYAKCVKEGACDPPISTKSITRDNYYGNLEFNNYPVIYVSWSGAEDYCKWAGRRLPSEAEWEKAASWDDENKKKSIYPWGNKINCQFANYGVCEGDTTAVGSYKGGQSSYGVFDMAGNVWEWVSDWYDSQYYVNSPSSNPFGPDTGQYRVRRGGAQNSNQDIVRVFLRSWGEPSSFNDSVGFRCARDATP